MKSPLILTYWLLIGRMAPAVFFMGMIFYFSAKPASDVVHTGGGWMELASRIAQWLAFGLAVEINWLKVGHFIGYFGLGLAYHHALTGLTLRPGIWTILLSAAYAVSDEIHQTFVPGRHAELRDIFIDTSAAACAVLAISWFNAFQKKNAGQTITRH